MRLLIATGIYPPDIGGPATYSSLLIKELPKRGIKTDLITYGPAGISRKIPKGLRHLIYFFSCFLKALKTDIIYAQNQISAGLPAMLVAKITGKKFMIKIVGDSVWEKAFQEYGIKDNIDEFQKKNYTFKIEVLRKLQRWVAKQSYSIIVPSKYLKKIVKKWGIDRRKIRVIYNAFDSKYKIKPGQERENFLISVGRLVPWKGFSVLIKVLSELPENIKLKIVGSGPREKYLKKLVSKLNLEKRVEILEKLPQKDLFEIMDRAKIFVLNTAYEGFPHIILEAMAMELPVITTNVCGNPEVVEDNYNGLLVEYNNKEQLKEAVLNMWKDEKLQKKLTENAKKSLNKFSKEKILKETIKILS